MSLSKEHDNDTKDAGRSGGRVIVGVGGKGFSEDELNRLRGGEESHGWSLTTEEEYMRRVQEKATAKAQDILAQAMREAQQIREKAAQEAMDEAAANCQAQLDAAVQQTSETLARAMETVDRDSRKIWQHYREDIVSLVRIAVERLLAVELDQRREEVMASLLDQALDAIDTHDGLVFRIRPEDEEIMQALLDRARSAHPTLERWGIKLDESLEPGGMVLESEEGMVDNSIGSRWASVEPIFAQLGIDNGESE